uniref:RecQ like helicase n=2 Tax=Macaca fascicularis TaxID=9541 RepID=A0A2K5UW73_MACFA
MGDTKGNQESYIVFLRKTLNKLRLVCRIWEFMQVLTMPIWSQKIRPQFIENGQPMKFRLGSSGNCCIWYGN